MFPEAVACACRIISGERSTPVTNAAFRASLRASSPSPHPTSRASRQPSGTASSTRRWYWTLWFQYGSGIPVPSDEVPRRQRLAVPELDQTGRDRDAVRREDLSGLEGGAQFVAGEPAGLMDLVPVDIDLNGGGAGHEAEHEAGGERPG